MGKRKAAAKKPTGPRKNEPLPTVFPCLFCNHEKSVMVKLDKKAGVGYLNCKVCNQQFQCAVNYLSAAVDVYSDWVDACDAVAKEDGEEPEQVQTSSRPNGGATSSRTTPLKKKQADGEGVTSNSNITYSNLHTNQSMAAYDDDY
ncbi:unnamed protein product [Blumeria hordei]|uniref:Transcription elongation factor 1 homolog n=1 Tax=Blumeria hordei TaxID=2867405 RepID=A0A383UM51_BLUHO|nr:unnamed protein product [Blumeria hordei]